MTVGHVLGYSKSTRAKCHAQGPCQGTTLPAGTLRYGRSVSGDLGETIEWCHWGCITPQILASLAGTSQKDIRGFAELKPSDQNKIRLAISLQRIDPTDIPASARVATYVRSTPSVLPSSQTQRKRSVAEAGFESSSTGRHLYATQEQQEEEVLEEEVVDELYCEMVSKVVGIQYYTGLVGPGEEVRLIREPNNRYDRNAIRVDNIGGSQVGHIPRDVAANLAGLLDRGAITVEGVIDDGNLSGSRQYNLSITLKIYGPSDKRRELEPLLVWATPGRRGFGPGPGPGPGSSSRTPTGRLNPPALPTPIPTQSQGTPAQAAARMEAARKQQEALQKAAELRQMLNSLEKVDDENRRASLLDTLCVTEDVLSMPTYSTPPGILSGELTVDLLKHQLQALEWCHQRENPVLPKTESDKPVQFWQLRKRGQQSYYYNIATKTPQENMPPLGRGGLFADAMGLGKTLAMIALIIATKKEVDAGFSMATLIVAPLSVMSNWEKQIADHCVPGTVSSCVYYGTKRSMSAADLQKHDIVITTYQTVAGEYEQGAVGKTKKKKSDRTLFEVAWKRVVLDEGHNIRNPKTKMAKSVVDLPASRRWVLSGTPIINSPRDLGSILTFLKICRPLDNEDFFKRLLLRPLKNGEPSGAELLRALMSHICIRRTKEMQDDEGKPLIELPSVEMIRIPVTLTDAARALYDEVEQLSGQRLQRSISETGMTAAVQSSALSMLTRLRQIALDPGLVPESFLTDLRNGTTNDGLASQAIVVSPAEKVRLQDVLAQAIEDSEECPICMDILNDPRISSCGHIYCVACIMEVLSRDPKCPLDRRQLTQGDLFQPPAPSDLTQRPSRVEEGLEAGASAKIDQLIHLLKLTPSNEKSLVFSQFTSFLDKIVERLEENEIPYVRFDGQMSAKRRQEAIARFSVPVEGIKDLETTESSAPRRPSRKTRNASFESTSDVNDLDDNDSDFVVPDDEDDLYDDVGSTSLPTRKKKKGKGKALQPNFQEFDSSPGNPRVMLLSLKAGAVGLNLTVANNVYLMDPWWQEGIESQAVDRVNRIGQTKSVHVYQLIADDTVESKVLDIQEKKKQLIKQAFSGIKNKETQRQQREARLQDLIELFGIRRQASQASG